jgi:hypothetical protein
VSATSLLKTLQHYIELGLGEVSPEASAELSDAVAQLGTLVDYAALTPEMKAVLNAVEREPAKITVLDSYSPPAPMPVGSKCVVANPEGEYKVDTHGWKMPLEVTDQEGRRHTAVGFAGQGGVMCVGHKYPHQLTYRPCQYLTAVPRESRKAAMSPAFTAPYGAQEKEEPGAEE